MSSNEEITTTTIPIFLTVIYYLLPISFSLYLLLTVIKFLHKVWFNPILITRSFSSQGIQGPSYKFLHGNAKEILNMMTESRSKPMEEFSHDIFPKLQPHIHSWIKTYGKTYLSWHGSKPQLVITDLDLIKEILSNRDESYPKKKNEGYVRKLVGDGLVMSKGAKWVKHRKLANYAFHAENLKGMIVDMITAADSMLDRWMHQEGKEIEVSEEFRVLTSEVISRTAFGSSYVEGKNIFEMLIKISSLLAANSFKIRFPGIGKLVPNKDELESEKLEKEIEKLILNMIKRREENMEKGELDGYGNDFLGLLIKANRDPDDSKRISVQDIIDECKTFYVGGHETTTSFLTWTCLLLALNTDWQDKARKEVIELFGSENPIFDERSLSRLKMMNMIMNESLRLYPPVPHLIRRVTRKERLGNLILPENLELEISAIGVHHDPDIWGEDVHLFKPERFSEGVAKATKNKTMAFLPFSAGPRNCVGMNFAMTNSKIVFAMILRHYRFTISPAYVHSPTQRLTILPQHGLQIILHAL